MRVWNSKQRELAAIRHEVPDRIPIDIICFDQPALAAQRLNVAPDSLLDVLGIDGRKVNAPYTGPLRPPENGTEFDAFGTPNDWWFHAKMKAPLMGVQSVREVERYPWPDPADSDFAAAGKQARELDARGLAVRGPYGAPVFSRACSMLGLEEALTCMLSNPAVFEAVMEHIRAYVVDYCARLLDACGPAMPILCLWDDFGTQRGLMISPQHWRRFVKPALADIFRVAKQRGRFVWFHSCGDVTSVLGDLIDIGVDVWETVQLHTLPISPRELKQQYGRHLAFFGGVSTQSLPWKTPQQVRDEVRRCIEALGEGGGYICGPDHHIKPDVSAENTLALFDEAVRFRAPNCTL